MSNASASGLAPAPRRYLDCHRSAWRRLNVGRWEGQNRQWRTRRMFEWIWVNDFSNRIKHMITAIMTSTEQMEPVLRAIFYVLDTVRGMNKVNSMQMLWCMIMEFSEAFHCRFIRPDRKQSENQTKERFNNFFGIWQDPLEPSFKTSCRDGWLPGGC